MTAILIAIIGILYIFGGFMAALITGWDGRQTVDVIKFIFWPVTIWFE